MPRMGIDFCMHGMIISEEESRRPRRRLSTGSEVRVSKGLRPLEN
jgi:hypothetical protein